MMPAEQDGRQRTQTENPASPSGIQTEKPLQPWELPGSFRADCEPHRGKRLFCAAVASLVFAIHNTLLLTVYCALDASGDVSISTPVVLGSTLALVAALAVGLTSYVLACRDLTRMQKGLMDRRGEKWTREARDLSRAAFGCCCLFGGLLLCFLLLR